MAAIVPGRTRSATNKLATDNLNQFITTTHISQNKSFHSFIDSLDDDEDESTLTATTITAPKGSSSSFNGSTKAGDPGDSGHLHNTTGGLADAGVLDNPQKAHDAGEVDTRPEDITPEDSAADAGEDITSAAISDDEGAVEQEEAGPRASASAAADDNTDIEVTIRYPGHHTTALALSDEEGSTRHRCSSETGRCFAILDPCSQNIDLNSQSCSSNPQNI